MEDFTQKPKKKGLTDDQKGWIVFIGLGVVATFGALYLLLHEDGNEDLANEVAAEVSDLQGEGYNTKLGNLLQAELKDIGDDSETSKLLKEMLKDLNYDAQISHIKTFTNTDFAGVNIDNVVVKSTVSEDNYTDITIKKEPNSPNKYFFGLDLESRQFDESISKNAWLVTKHKGAVGALEFNEEGGLKSFESVADRTTFKDGSGFIAYAVLDDVEVKFDQNSEAGKSDFEAVFRAAKVDLGEALKFILGPIKPMQVDFDLKYSGDPLAKLQKIADETPDVLKYLGEDNAELAKKASAAEKFSGHLKLNEFALMSEDMGVKSDMDLEFAGFPYQPMPKGDVAFTIKNYAKIIAYLRGFFPIPQAEIDRALAQANEYFVNNGTDLIFSAKLDGSKLVKLGNGKEFDVLAEFKNQGQTTIILEEEEDFRSEFETPVKSDSKPVSIPQVEQKSLGEL